MSYTTLIQTSELAGHLHDPEWALFDCRFDMANPDAGRSAYAGAHIPGAVYAHLNQDLSGPASPGRTGRHPLPAPETLAAKLGTWGVGPDTQVVVYDDAGGAIAGRMWWLLRWLGHEAVALLDGGLDQWRREGRPLDDQGPRPAPRRFPIRLHDDWIATTGELIANLSSLRLRVIDARAEERYRGDHETVDPVAGHVPGAVNHPFKSNLDPKGRFLSPEHLHDAYQAMLGDKTPPDTVLMCGSGVTACHDLLAMELAGLSGARLYPGSWSEWITDPQRPVATGNG